MACSSSKRNCASARASSVLPTPVGPRNRKEPIGRFGSDRPARPRRTALATASMASSCGPTLACGCQFSPATITLKKGETVTLRLRSEDVTHGFFQRALKLSAAIEPGQIVDVTLTPQTAGRFLTICDHFCGAQHGNMHMNIVVEE